MSDPPHPDDALLEFLRTNEVDCPMCGYNLHALTRPVCPECRQDLMLTVGTRNPRFGWLLVAVAPGIFSGIAAVLLAIPIIIVPFVAPRAGPPPLFIVATDIFGWCSGIFALILLWKRYAFLRLERRVQIAWAMGLWGVHAAAFGLLLVRVR